ncbi:hypothetical protein [Streptomyces sp.]|uniref:hypothetical protein n=1 Tax=Streptomyces sp. TaxID=1931 RepID=UPI002F424402
MSAPTPGALPPTREQPEPALRPAARRSPGLDVLRNACVFRDKRDVVVRDRHGTERRHLVGDGGIRRAVHVDAPGPPVGGRMGPDLPGPWGYVDLRNAKDRCVLRIELDDWLPEGAAFAAEPPRGERLLAVTGVAGLLADLRVPVTTVRERDNATVDKSAWARPGRLLPVWNTLGRGAALAVWFVAFVIAILPVDRPPVGARVVTAGAAVLLPLLTLAARAQTALRERRLPSPGGLRVTPDPEPGAGMTVRFVTTAAVRVQDRDLVLVDQVGQERWLPRTGPHRVAALVRIVEHGTRSSVAVELHGPDGQVRGALPWACWFAGAKGEARWKELVTATALPVRDRELAAKEHWPQHRVAAMDTDLSSLRPAVARRVTRFPSSQSGGAGTGVALGTGAIGLLGCALVEGHPTARAVGVTLAVLALLGTLLPLAAHELHGRLRLDRPAPGQEEPAS